MSSPRVDPNSPAMPMEAPKVRQAPSTPFGQVLSGNQAVVSGAQSNNGLVGGPVLAAAVREAGSQVLGGALTGGGGAGGGGGGAGGAAGVMNAPTQGAEMSQMFAMQRESQSFNLQLLNLQQNVQDENRRFTTLSNVLKSAHDTAKSAVSNIRS